MYKQISVLVLVLLGSSLAAISLEESISLAKENNLELLQAREEIYKADATYKDVRGSLLPQLKLQGSYSLAQTWIPDSSIPPAYDFSAGLDDTADDNDQFLAGSLNGIMSSMIPSSPMDEGSLAMQVQLQQVLFLGGKLINGIKAVDRYRSIQSLMYQVKEKELVLNTTELYYQCLLAKQLATVQEDALELASRHLERVTLMQEEGFVAEFDALRARLEVEKLRPQVMEAENNYRLALAAFRRQIGIPDSEHEPDGDITIPLIEDLTEEEALQSAYQNRLEIRLASISTEVSQIKYNAEKGNYLPNVALQADYSLYTAADGFGIERDDFGSRWTVGIGFEIPIFTGLSNSSKRAHARHSYLQAQMQERDIQDLIALEIKQNYLNLVHAKQNLEAQTQNIQMAERNLELAQYRFDNQVGIQLEVFDAQIMLSAIRLEYYNAVYKLNMAQKKLNKSMGLSI